ncbi:MAG: adenylate/guanylate cyclase domain-containing protein [Acidimicrobiales bacterium]
MTSDTPGRSAEELAEAAGTTSEAVRSWAEAGLLGGAEPFADVDLERARLLEYASRRGVSTSQLLAVSVEQGDIVGQFVEMIVGAHPRVGHTLDDAAALAGLSPEQLERLWVAAGLSEQSEAYAEDVEALRSFGVTLDAGLPEEALGQLLRVYTDALGRVAEAESRLFHFYVHDRLRREGLRGTALAEAVSPISDTLRALNEPALRYFHHKAFQRALRDDFVVHATDDAQGLSGTVGTAERAVVFVDLAGFTPLTDSMGDEAAAGLIEQFSLIVRRVAVGHDGRIVKQIGDAFMVVFADPAPAVSFGLDVEDAVRAEPRFPAVRVGVHAGPVLYREGDFVGANVNLAARVTSLASAHELIVTSAVALAVGHDPDIEVDDLGPQTLKGVAQDVPLHRLRRRGTIEVRPVDPVCRMELDPAERNPSRDHMGRQFLFCSDTCARRFDDDPARYALG